jgi:hypothetical protein
MELNYWEPAITFMNIFMEYDLRKKLIILLSKSFLKAI